MLEPQVESRPAIYRVFILSLAAPSPGDPGHHNSDISGDTDHLRQDEGGASDTDVDLDLHLDTHFSRRYTQLFAIITVETRKL